MTKTFRIEIPQADVDDLRTRLRNTRWPAGIGADDWSRGVPAGYLKALVDYWANDFDWRAQEAALNAIPQFLTEIDGQTIHFFHVRSADPEALPLILTHGWPSSPIEFVRLIDHLSAQFHLVLAELPGYGFSNPLSDKGFSLFGVARAWAALMAELGYERYAVQGTDVGSGVAGMLAMLDAPHVVGVHLSGTAAGTPFGPALDPEQFEGIDRSRAERFNKFREDGTGYIAIQSTRPQTIAYALNDSPVAQLAWMVEKFHDWSHGELDRDLLLATVSLYWFTGSGASTALAMYDGMQAWKAFAAQQEAQPETPEESGPPIGVAVFAADSTIRSLMDPAGKIKHWSEFDRGGHFAAMEEPELLAGDIREFFGTLR
jgi:pimeloyl-ACP methyl ester carboxylesterase